MTENRNPAPARVNADGGAFGNAHLGHAKDRGDAARDNRAGEPRPLDPRVGVPVPGARPLGK